jgi:acetyl esterase
VSHAYDPELAPMIEALPVPDLSDVAELRAMITERIGALDRFASSDDVAVHHIQILGVQSTAPVAIRLYEPRPHLRSGGALLDLHGGGFVLGALANTHEHDMRLARETGAVVVAVDYRLSPEHPYPAALDDCHAALCWLSDRADALGMDRDRIAVRGVSAGGGLAAALALLLRDEGGPRLCFQFLVTPALDDRLRTDSVQRFTDTPLWTAQNARDSWAAYLGADRAGRANVPVYAAPARADDLTELPAAYISVMEFDPLRDEGIAYARALLAAGINVELHLFPGTFHGSVAIGRAEVSRRERQEEISVLMRHVGHGSARRG